MKGESSIWPILLLVFSLIIVFSPLLSGGYLYFFHDLKAFYLPCRSLLSDALKDGHLPLWTTLSAGGFPLHAEGQTALFYPPNLLLYGLLTWPTAFAVSLVLHYLFGGLGVLTMARDRGVSNYGAALAGITFALSGFMMTHLFHVSIWTASSWSPWILFLALRAAEGRRPFLHGALAGLFVGFQNLAGHPQISLITLIGVVAVIVPMLLGRTTHRPFRIFFLPLAIAGSGAILGAVQLLPTLELLPFTSRSVAANYDFLVSGSFPPHHLIMLVFPYFYGVNAWPLRQVSELLSGVEPSWPWNFGGLALRESHIYLGIVPLLLSVVGIFGSIRSRRESMHNFRLVSLPYIFLASVGLLLMLGRFSPLFPLYHIAASILPLRFPARFSLLVTIALCVFVGVGWDRLHQMDSCAVRRLAKGCIAASLILFILFSIASLGITWLTKDSTQDHQMEGGGNLSPGGSGIQARELAVPSHSHMERRWNGMQQTCQSLYLPTALQFCLLILAGLWLLVVSFERGKSIGRILTACLVLIDLMIFGLLYNPLMPREMALSNPVTARQVLMKERGQNRLAVLDATRPDFQSEMDSLYGDGPYADFLHPDFSFFTGIANCGNPSPLSLRSWDELMDRLGLGFRPSAHEERVMKFSQWQHVLDIVRVQFITTSSPLSLGGWDAEISSGGVWLYNRGPSGRSVLMYETTNVRRSDPTAAFSSLFTNTDAIFRDLLMDRGNDTGDDEPHPDQWATSLTADHSPLSINPAVFTEYHDLTVTFTADISRDAYALIGDAWYPGWRAHRNGQLIPVCRGFGLFRVIPLTAGFNHVVMDFCPVSVKTGLFITLLGLMSIAIIALTRWKVRPDSSL